MTLVWISLATITLLGILNATLTNQQLYINKRKAEHALEGVVLLMITLHERGVIGDSLGDGKVTIKEVKD